MPDTPADLEAALVAFLRAHSVINMLTEARVFAGELPPAEAKFMPRPAIVLRSSGGVSLTAESTLDHDTQRIDVFAFGLTPRAAATLMRQAASALRQLQRSVHAGVLIHWVNPAGGSSQGREPQTEWPRQFQSFQALHSLTQIEP